MSLPKCFTLPHTAPRFFQVCYLCIFPGSVPLPCSYSPNMIDDFDSNHPHVASPESTNTFDALRLVKTSVGAARRLAFLAYSQRDTD
jgi:hypothetical protein